LADHPGIESYLLSYKSAVFGSLDGKGPPDFVALRPGNLFYASKLRCNYIIYGEVN
jgi:hypothetical protein